MNASEPLSPALLRSNPFGTKVHADEVVETLSFLDDWEARYGYIIDLGRELPAMPDALRTEARLLRGCQSQVWIDAARDQSRLWFSVDSDAHIVRGLIAIVLAALNGRTPEELLAFDIEAYFGKLDLLQHLSVTRGNGLRALVARMRGIAAQASAPPLIAPHETGGQRA
jgi:cysteine desulfuration protein SufE